MLARAWGAVLDGVDAVPVRVEVDINSGLPAFTVVGLPDATVQEARDRVRGAITHSGHDYPMQRITANLAPSDMRKQGAGLDLVLALGILAANEAVPEKGLEGRMFCGELGLSGEVRPVRGALQAAEAARSAGLEQVVCPQANAQEAALAGLPGLGVGTLRDALDIVRGRRNDVVVSNAESLLADPPHAGLDLAQVRDQETAKRALEIAATGGHNLLLSGPPGSGKTLLARALPGVLPRLTLDEALEVTRIHSAAGLLAPDESLVRTRPFRAPHHGVSMAGMVGGGSQWTRPGEVTLAHRGVLMMDEFPEFPRSVLEALRQPLEDGHVTITRARQTTTYPARFMLVAAMNPCPCGYRGSDRQCPCTPHQFETYRLRVSGPLMDRIDMQITVDRVETSQLLRQTQGATSADVRAAVEAARQRASCRFRKHEISCNAELPIRALMGVCALDPESAQRLTRTANRYRMSARSVHRVLRVARTIADLDGSERVGKAHVMEAVQFRIPEREVDR